MQDPLSVFCRIAERVQDLEKSLHIFCQIHVLPVAGIKVPWILYSEDRIGKVRGFCGVGQPAIEGWRKLQGDIGNDRQTDGDKAGKNQIQSR